METRTLDALNQLIATLERAGIAIVLAIVIGLMVVAFILLTRRQSKTESAQVNQFNQAMTLLAGALNREDSETARAISDITKVITPLVEIVALVKISMDQNTQAFIKNSEYRGETLAVTKELASLQAENNTQVAALRIDVKEWPQAALSSIGALEKNLEKSLIELKHEIVQSILELPPDSGLAKYFQDILSKLDQILESVTGNAKLIEALSPKPTPPALPPAPSNTLIQTVQDARRGTSEVKSIKPEDAVPDKKTGTDAA